MVIDDRDERPGVKFAEADLIGWPVQIVVGKRGLANGEYELKTRATNEKRTVAFEEFDGAIEAAKQADDPVAEWLKSMGKTAAPQAQAAE